MLDGPSSSKHVIELPQHPMIAKSDECLLDPTLWQQLPEEVMERVLSKVSFSGLVRFRGVSKHWNSIMIPDAARRGKVMGKSLVLYHDVDGLNRSLFTFGVSTDDFWRYYRRSHRLLGLTDSSTTASKPIAASGGLLFSYIAPTSVHVWNPVLGKQKLLCPPLTLLPVGLFYVLVGVAVDAETANYRILVAYLETSKQLQHKVLLYDSMTSSWKHTTPLRVPHIVGDEQRILPGMHRSIAYEGNLYFSLVHIITPVLLNQVVFKFDMQNEAWTKVEERPTTTSNKFDRITTSNEAVKLLGAFVICDKWLRNWLRDDSPDMEPFAEMKGFLEVFSEEERELDGDIHYFGFREDDTFVHVWQLRGNDDGDGSGHQLDAVRVVLHNVLDDSYRYVSGAVQGQVYPRNFWLFTPSLTSSV